MSIPIAFLNLKKQIVAAISNFILSAGSSTSGAIDPSEGKAYHWGDNTNDVIRGDNKANNPIENLVPTTYSGSLIISDYSLGNTQVLTIESSTGNAYAWGLNNFGQVGDNTNIGRSSPVSVVGGRSYSKVSTSGNGTTCYAIEGSTGNIYAWGTGTTGQLGDNTIINKSSPTSVLGGRSYSRLSSGGNHVLAIEGSTGNAYAWGQGTTGQLGDNTALSKSSPISVVGGRSFSQVACSGGSTSSAIEGSTGNAYAWGNGAQGQLGDYTTLSKSSPVSVVGGRSYSQIAAGQNHVLAIEGSTGNAYAWGFNSTGKLGDNTILSRSSPTSVVGGRSFNQISAGPSHSLAYEASNGIIWAWGSNSLGQLGNGLTGLPASPVSSLFSVAINNLVCTSGDIIYTEASTGNAYAYGSNGSGTSGNNTSGVASASNTPVSVFGGRSYSRISGGENHTVAIEGSTGNAYAWGLGTSGQLGEGTVAVNRSSPVSVVGGRSYSQVANGSSNSSAAIEGSTGNAYAWGMNGNGQLGDGTTANRSSPVSVVGGRSFSKIILGNTNSTNTHVIAIEGSTGNAYAWGLGTTGQLGDNSLANRSSPVSVAGGRSFSQISGGQSHSAAIEGSTGKAYVWGQGSSGQLGNNTTSGTSSPVSVLGGRSYSKITCGNNFVAAIEGSTGNAYAWGQNTNGQLGNGSTANRSSPVSVAGGRSYSQIAASGQTRISAYEPATGIIWVWGTIINSGTAYGDGNVSSPISVGRLFI